MTYLQKMEMKQYLSNALECIEFKLIRDRSQIDDDSISFHPEFAHQIFGENETIFGYKDLQIRLYYTSGPLNIYMGSKHTSRIDDNQSVGLKSDDIFSSISKLLTTGCYYTNIDEFLSKLDKEESFQPYGDKIFSWEIEGDDNSSRTFEIYECTIHTPGFVTYHARLQTFLLWFVDAASYIDSSDPNWMFFVCYERYTSSDGRPRYATVGYTSIYKFFGYPQHIRPRISQMLVLPPFQGMGIGAKFVETVYNRFKGDPTVIDITVEDPSDDFRRVRNFVDAKLCLDLPEFAPDRLKAGFSKEMIKAAKTAWKINAKQCRIIYEILRLNATNVNQPNEYRDYRLCVKQRLNVAYHKQKEDLKKMEKKGVDITAASAMLPSTEEHIEQLKAEYEVQEKEYMRIIERLKMEQ